MGLIIRTLVWMLSLLGVHWIGSTVTFDKFKSVAQYFRLESSVRDIEDMIGVIKQNYMHGFYAEIPTDRGVPDSFSWKKHIYYKAILAEMAMNGSVCIGGIHCTSHGELDIALITAATDFRPDPDFKLVNGELVLQ